MPSGLLGPGDLHTLFIDANSSATPRSVVGFFYDVAPRTLRLGPPLYDLASLLNDTLFPPAAAEEALLAKVPISGDARRSYHRAAAQRCLKAVGTFAKFAHLGADRHVPLIAPTLAHFVKHFSQIPEGTALAARLREAWSPALETPGPAGSVTLGLV